MTRKVLVTPPSRAAQRLRRARSMVGLAVGLSLIACSSPERNPRQEIPNAAAKNATAADILRSEMLRLAGPGARDCGFVPLGHDPADAWRCAQAADGKGGPYWFALQRQGIDSQVWTAVLLTPEGKRYLISFDSNVQGGSGLNPRFTQEACPDRVFLFPDTPRGASCSQKER